MKKLLSVFLVVLCLFIFSSIALGENHGIQVQSEYTDEGKNAVVLEYEYMLKDEGYFNNSLGVGFNCQNNQPYGFGRFYFSRSPYSTFYIDASYGLTTMEKKVTHFRQGDEKNTYQEQDIKVIYLGFGIGYKYNFYSNYIFDIRYNYQLVDLHMLRDTFDDLKSRNTCSIGLGILF